MTGGHDVVCISTRRYCQRGGDNGPGGHDISATRDDVEGLRQQATQPRPPWIVERKRAHHAIEHVEVVEQGLGGCVDDDQLGPFESIQMPGAGRIR